eukprot:TRINITY_DN389_c0_g1_i2.p1 TRINITY_DN389_c0_g1~~TRINITY_DN389_c0_g1_i2.p1  ORF type:complete len:177 (-),score=41.18 TRINITY_DN389_c0_g1_i2:159-689(-)
MHEYVVVGRKTPTERDIELLRTPQVFRVRLFAPNEVVAKSRFWKLMKASNKLKRKAGQIIAVHEIFEETPEKVKNIGILFRYKSTHGEHNMWKEFRDTTRTGAVEQLFQDMGGRHRANYCNIQIIDVRTLKPEECRRNYVTQFHNSKLKFPVPHSRRLARKNGNRFQPTRPTTYFG